MLQTQPGETREEEKGRESDAGDTGIPQRGTKSKEKRSSNSQLRTNDSLDGREIQEKKDSRDGCKKQLRSIEGSDSLLAYSYYRFSRVFARSLVSRSTRRSSKKRKNSPSSGLDSLSICTPGRGFNATPAQKHPQATNSPKGYCTVNKV